MISPEWDAGLLILWILIQQDIRETIDHHWSTSIFQRIPHAGIRDWFWSSWLRRHRGRDRTMPMHTWLGMPVGFGPITAVYDAWHFCKALELFAVFAYVGYYGLGITGWILAAFVVVTWFVFGTLHSFVVYGWLMTYPKRRWKIGRN